MYEVSQAWRPIDDQIKSHVDVSRPFAMSRLVLVRLGSRQARARWRHPLERYNSSTDKVIERLGAWWDEHGRTLEFEPLEYRDL